jgi:hypothetical protein
MGADDTQIEASFQEAIVFHGSLAPRLKLRQFASLEIILRGFVVDTWRRGSQ